MLRMRKKQQGSGTFIALGFVLLVLFSILVYAVELSEDIEKSRAITATMREYVMIMESNGCLTSAQQQRLELELNNLGITNITFNADPLIKVAYGEEVTLSISGTVDALSIVGYKDFKLERASTGIGFTKTIKSTAQY